MVFSLHLDDDLLEAAIARPAQRSADQRRADAGAPIQASHDQIAYLRRVLSRLSGVPPEALRFKTGQHGKPEIDQPLEARDLQFSLSHTHGLVVCAAAWGCAVGVDVERIRRHVSLLDLVDRYFDPGEAAALRALPDAERQRRFLEYWTLKEAYAKARGLGLNLPFNRVAFRLGANREIGVTFRPALGDTPSRWRFALHHIGGEHVVATAVARP